MSLLLGGCLLYRHHPRLQADAQKWPLKTKKGHPTLKHGGRPSGTVLERQGAVGVGHQGRLRLEKSLWHDVCVPWCPITRDGAQAKNSEKNC